MSGTSLDGLDLICVEFKLEEKSWFYKILKTETVPFDTYILSEIKKVLGKNINPEKNELSRVLGEWMANCVLTFQSSINLEIDLIASHGQTIFHEPENGTTIQIGDGQTMANICNLTVVNDFRSQDVKRGGQGAPLVPIGDLILFSDYKYCLNLGGIANISEKVNGQIKAFDLCICNIGANYLASQQGQTFDKNGDLGSKGSLIPNLLEEWNGLAYFSKIPPKSLDASFFESKMFGLHSVYRENSLKDVLRTLYEHIAFQISIQISDKKSEILTTGGGVYNNFLIKLMRENYGLNIMIPEKEIIEFKEGLIFAFMGLLRMRNENNVLATVTGSEEDHSSGLIHYPN